MKKNVIPKIVHYIWLGNNAMPKYMIDFLNRAKIILKNYKFIIWKDEDVTSFYDNSNYVLDAIHYKKYAFLSDYLRLSILEKYGGIYLDTDVCVMKNFNKLLKYELILGNIVDCSIGTAVIASRPNNPELRKWIIFMENNYDHNKKFISNNHWMTQLFLETYEDFVLNGKKQILKNNTVVFPKTYFESGKPFYIFGGGYSIHLCAGSWINKEKEFSELEQIATTESNKKQSSFFIRLLRKIYHLSFFFKQKQLISNFKLHTEENKKYPFYNEYLQTIKNKK